MKKQLLIAAVAATMSTVSMADISITGGATFDYWNTDNSNGTSANDSAMEVTLNVKGKSGATAVVTDIVLGSGDDKAGGNTAGSATVVVENMYVTTNLGPVKAKVGNYSTSTESILGEIDEGGRSYGKITLSYTTNGIKFYGGNGGNTASDTINNNMFVGVVATVEGWKLQAKKASNTVNAFGVSGKAGLVGIRVEYKDASAVNSDVVFANFTAKLDNINLGLAILEAEKDNLITENDSSIFVVENGLTNHKGNSNVQLSASIGVDGTTYSAFVGKIGFAAAATDDRNYFKVAASRALDSGVKATVSYTDKETSNTADSKSFNVELKVAF